MEILKNPNVEIHELNTDKRDNEIRFDADKMLDCNFKRMLIYYDSVIGSPIEHILTSLLCACSGACGKYPFWDITRSLKVFLNCWGVIIGPSTIMRKSSGVDEVCKDLDRIEKKYKNEYDKRMNEYEETKKEYEKELKEKKEKNKGKVLKPEREDYLILPNDFTTEALCETLTKSNRGLIIFPEFGGLLAQLNRSYNQDSKIFLTNFFDVPANHKISRVGKDPIEISRPYFSLIGGSTLEWIKSNSSDQDLRSGFFSRMLFSIRNKNDKKYFSLLELRDKISFGQNSPFYFDTRSVFDYLTSIKENIQLDISKEAKDLHIEFDKENYNELLRSDSEDQLSFKSRLLIYSLKFAGIIALCDQREVIEVKDVKNAIMISDYYKRNIERIISDLQGNSEFLIKEKRVMERIRKAGVISRRDLLQQSNMRSKDLDEFVNNLVQKESIHITYKQSDKGGRKGVWYNLS